MKASPKPKPPRLSTLARHLQQRMMRIGPQTVDAGLDNAPYSSVTRDQVVTAFTELVNAGLATYEGDDEHGLYSIAGGGK